jgi:hypothetical protein
MSTSKRRKGTGDKVRNLYSQYPDWNAKQIWEAYKKLIPAEEKPVTLNAIQKHLEPLKKIYDSIKSLDAPWHLGLLQTDQFIPTNLEGSTIRVLITPEAIKIITEIQKKMEYDNDNKSKTFDLTGPFMQPTIPRLTIRQALWISRLYKLWDQPLKAYDDGEEHTLTVLQQIYLWSLAYAEREIICKLNKIPFDTFAYDQFIRLGYIPNALNSHQVFFNSAENGEFVGWDEAISNWGKKTKLKSEDYWKKPIVDVNGNVVQHDNTKNKKDGESNG